MSDKVFLSQRLDNNSSEISAGKKTSGCLKLSLVAGLDNAFLDAVANALPKISILLLFIEYLTCQSKNYILHMLK